MLDEQAGPELDARVAVEVMGWKWMSWLGIPVHGAPEYPAKCRVRQFMSLSPKQMGYQRWQKFLHESEGREATGDEPLSYSYCSSQGSNEPVPPFSTDWSAAGEVLEKVTSQHADEFAVALMRELGRGTWFTRVPRDSLTNMAVSDVMRRLAPLAICLAALEAVRQPQTPLEPEPSTG